MKMLFMLFKKHKNQYKTLVTGLFIIFSCATYSQEDFNIQIFGGPDFNRVVPPNDSIEVSNSVTPFFGLSWILPSAKHNQLHLGATYFMKSSRDDNKIRYRNIGVSVFSDYYLNVSKGVYLTFGPQYSIVMDAHKQNGAVKTPMSGYDSYLSLNAGINLQLQKHLNMGVVYEYPFNSKLNTVPSFKIKLAWTIADETFKVKEKKHRMEESSAKIHKLKKTAILVSLRSYRPQIESLSEPQHEKRRKLVVAERDRRNTELMKAFEAEFHFCPVYFFYNDDLDKILKKDFSNVFVNEKLEIDNRIKCDYDEFLIGTLGYTKRDTVVTYSNADVYKNGENLAEGYANTAAEESDLEHYGLYITNQNGDFMDKPFPGFVSNRFGPIRRSTINIIRILNERLYHYYEKQNFQD